MACGVCARAGSSEKELPRNGREVGGCQSVVLMKARLARGAGSVVGSPVRGSNGHPSPGGPERLNGHVSLSYHLAIRVMSCL